MAVPDLVLIPYEDDEYSRFTTVGQFGNYNQFMAFVTGAYPANWGVDDWSYEVVRNQWMNHKRWYAVLHQFDAEGNHLHTDAWSGGSSQEERESIRRAEMKLNEMLAMLGPYRLCNIQVKLFGVETDGYFFGLIYDDGIDPDDFEEGDLEELEYVMLEPNDIMFHPPWDSGEYST